MIDWFALGYFIIACLALAVFAYVIARAAAIGYYQTKREHFEDIIRRTQQEEDDEASS